MVELKKTIFLKHLRRYDVYKLNPSWWGKNLAKFLSFTVEYFSIINVKSYNGPKNPEPFWRMVENAPPSGTFFNQFKVN